MAVRYTQLASAPSNTWSVSATLYISYHIFMSNSNVHSTGITLWTSVGLHQKNIKIESLCPWICCTFQSVFIRNNFVLSGYISKVQSVLLFGCETCKMTNQITNKLQTSANRCLWRIMGIRWPKIISNTELWEAPGEKPVILLMRTGKWQWISHPLRNGDESIEKQVLGWNPQGARRRGRLKRNLKITVLEEAGKCCKF